MNIVVIGSCTDSSNLAKELNKRLQHSIIARVDLLKDLKQLLLPGACATTDTNLGTYIGDVERFDYSNLSEVKRSSIKTALVNVQTSLLSNSSKHKTSRRTYVSTFDALTNGFPSGTYSFIKVYSGVVTDDMMLKLPQIRDCIFVKVKNPKDIILDITLSENATKQIQSSAFAFIECNSIEDVFLTEVFQLLLETDKTPDKKTPEPPQQTETVEELVTAEVVDETEVAFAA
jgi:hypothetical protein